MVIRPVVMSLTVPSVKPSLQWAHQSFTSALGHIYTNVPSHDLQKSGSLLMIDVGVISHPATETTESLNPFQTKPREPRGAPAVVL